MRARKSYGQFCGLARALDRVGERWTLLIVRELLLGPRTFRELAGGLAGISPAVLTQRLGALVDEGLVERSDEPVRSKSVEYRLSPAGLELEPVVFELLKWGSRWMVDGPGQDHADPAWSKLALRALLDGQPAPVRGVVHLDVQGHELTVRARGRHREVLVGRQGRPDALVSLELPAALGIASGELPLSASGARVVGSRRTASGLLQPAPRGSA